MRAFSENHRLAVTGATCSLLITLGGFIALLGQSQSSVLVPSLLLSVAILAACVGVAYSRNRDLGWGIAALIAAALPLFYLLYAAGAAILKYFGRGMAGGLLVALGAVIALGAVFLWMKATRSPPRAQH